MEIGFLLPNTQPKRRSRNDKGFPPTRKNRTQAILEARFLENGENAYPASKGFCFVFCVLCLCFLFSSFTLPRRAWLRPKRGGGKKPRSSKGEGAGRRRRENAAEKRFARRRSEHAPGALLIGLSRCADLQRTSDGSKTRKKKKQKNKNKNKNKNKKQRKKKTYIEDVCCGGGGGGGAPFLKASSHPFLARSDEQSSDAETQRCREKHEGDDAEQRKDEEDEEEEDEDEDEDEEDEEEDEDEEERRRKGKADLSN
jgi:hypothetical protein